MKLIIAGSRSITDYEIVRQAVMDSGFWAEYRHELEIVCGMAPGVDMLGLEFARRNKLLIHSFPADWDNLLVPGARIKLNRNGKKYNAAAGAMRNIEMGKFSDALVAVWDGKSRGTKQMIEWAEDNGLETYVHIVEVV